jgi:putative type II/III system pilus formation protein
MRLMLCIALLASTTIFPTTTQASNTKHVRYIHKVVRPLGIGVVVDQAKMVSLERPAKAMFVGNPAIADVTVVDAKHAFILGRTFGITNLVAVDAAGRQISNQQITVVNGQQAVTYNLGAGQYNYSCTRAHCETAPRPGDPTPYWQNTEQAITTHEDTAMKNATSASTTLGSPQ